MSASRTFNLLRGNRATSITIAVTVGISSFLLSTIGTIMYDMWADAEAQALAQGADWGAQLADTLLATALLYAAVVIFACIALVLIIRNAFAASMGSRIHQLGILATVGATPQQIRRMLIRESVALSLVPGIIGIALGIASGAAFVHIATLLGQSIGIQQAAPLEFRYSPGVLAATILCVAATVLASAGAPARKMAKMPPLAAIASLDEPQLSAPARRGAISRLFGIEGELAVASRRLSRNSSRSASAALAISFLVLAAFLSFMTISKLSVAQTYYERYGIAWDLVVDVPDATPDALQAVIDQLPTTPLELRADRSDKGARIYVRAGEAGASAAEQMVGAALGDAGYPSFEVVDMHADRERSEAIWHGYSLVVGGFCATLALIGIAGAAAQAVNAVQQRKREFARYRSIGMTPGGIVKMLLIEGVLSVLRPILIAAPFALALATGLCLLGQQPLPSFAAAFPYAFLGAYLGGILLCVLTAYLIGANRVCACDLPRTLRDDSLI